MYNRLFGVLQNFKIKTITTRFVNIIYKFVSDMNYKFIVKWHVSRFIKIGFNLQVQWESAMYFVRVW